MSDKKTSSNFSFGMTKEEEQERVGLDLQMTFPEQNTWKINLLSPATQMNLRRLLKSTFDFNVSAK